MGHAAAVTPCSAEDFLAWDATQTERHEYLASEVYAMAGAGEGHTMAAGNVYMALRTHLAGTPCRTFMTDMKLRVEAANAYFYPDVFVTCSAGDAADPMVKREPVLVVEVLSPGTAGYDCGSKFAAYRTLGTLREYALVDPEARRTDLYRLGADGLWVLHPVGPADTLRLASVELEVPAATLWAEVPAAGQAAPG